MQAESGLPTSSTNPMRARTVLELLDATFRVYRENLITFLTLSALVVIPLNVLNLLFYTDQLSGSLAASSYGRYGTVSGAQISQICGAALIVIILTLAQTTILNGVITYITSERVFEKKLSLGEAWAGARPKLVKMAWAYVMFYLLIIAFATATGLVAAVCAPVIIAFLIIVYFAINIGAFIAPVAMLENMTSGAAATRAYILAKSRFWQVLMLGALVAVISSVVSFAFTTLLNAIFLSNTSVAASTGGQIVSVVITSFVTIVTVPLLPIAMTLMYYDVRIRKEGLDLALQTFGPDARPHHIASPVTSGGLITVQDLINIAALVGILIVLVLVFGTAIAGILNSIAPGLGNLPINP